MTSDELRLLLEKLQSGTITDEERLKLEAWDRRHDRQEGLDILTMEEELALHERLWDKVSARAAVEGRVIPLQRKSGRKIYTRVAAAAAVLILVSAGIFYWMNHLPKPDRIVQQPVPQQDVQPGGDKAMLTLGDGSKIELDNADNGVVARQGDVAVIKTAKGVLAYNAGTSGASGSMSINTISTPRGGQYKLVLPDGTEVWLNAASSLTYPTVFTGKERRVSLNGEAYFKVTHDAKQPFIVDAAYIEVHDLGTEFNINAYYDEPVIQTTLLKGLAEVRNGKMISTLEPGTAAIVDGRTTLVKLADAMAAAAWKNGIFQFRQTGLKTIMRQVSRWYNIDVEYEGAIPEKRITGEAFRNSSLLEMLKILELSGVRFHLVAVPDEGRPGKIVITQ